MIVIDVQVLLGIIIWVFNSGWDAGFFFAVLHPLLMLGALAIAHIGLVRARRRNDTRSNLIVAWSFLASLVLVVMAVGIWPNIELAQSARIYCERGVVVNDPERVLHTVVRRDVDNRRRRGGSLEHRVDGGFNELLFKDAQANGLMGGLMIAFGVSSVNVLFGVIAGTLFTLFVVPVAYDQLAQNTGSPGDTRRQLEREMQDQA